MTVNQMNKDDFVIDENGVLTEYRGHDLEVVLPDNVRVIGKRVFNSDMLKQAGKVIKLTIPEGVTEIDSIAFSHSKIREIILPSTLKRIGTGAFRHCEDLHSINIPDGVTEIGIQAFSHSSLKEIRLPAKLERIGDEAFFDCRNLEKIVYEGNGHLEIGARAFTECRKLLDPSGFFIFQDRLYDFYPDHYESDIQVNLPESVRFVENGIFNFHPRVHIIMPIHCPQWRSFPLEDRLPFIESHGSTLSFRDESGSIAAKVILAIESEENIVQRISFGAFRCKPEGGFNFERYDSFFERLSNPHNKVQMALVRLRYPYELTKQAEDNYVSFLRKSSLSVGKDLIVQQDMETWKALAEKKIFRHEDIPEMIAFAQEQKHYDFAMELMEYVRTAFHGTDIFQSLNLPDNTNKEE